MGESRRTGASWPRKWALLAIALGLALLAAGRVRVAGAWAIVKAPNYGQSEVAMLEPPADVSRAIRAEVGPPRAMLEAWVFDPEGPPRGTTLVLHGIRDDKRALVGFGRALRDRGMRAVLVDLRGHGGSSGRWLTYGVRESRDLSQLLDQLEAVGVLDGPVSVFGASYGGAVGLQLAAIDPRVHAVVSSSTFASLRDVVPPQASAHVFGGSWLPQAVLDWIVDDAGALGGFSPDAADTRAAVARTDARVLLIHGREDRVVPYAHARALYRACGGRCALHTLPGADHAGALASPEASEAALSFLERHGTLEPSAGGLSR
ncbi:MAG: alpha/beta fold hydrolase [Myxococcota bacterium]|nr:alpha/beta fold hydrolase [Myxococcota bacterium]